MALTYPREIFNRGWHSNAASASFGAHNMAPSDMHAGSLQPWCLEVYAMQETEMVARDKNRTGALSPPARGYSVICALHSSLQNQQISRLALRYIHKRAQPCSTDIRKNLSGFSILHGLAHCTNSDRPVAEQAQLGRTQLLLSSIAKRLHKIAYLICLDCLSAT